jgi:MinD-like ATPase involved in chromosome partitioning or flagellar assembly
VIAIWNLAGGVGKTTLATCLAFAASQKHIKTLLVGLGAPDDMGILLPRIKAQPNLSHWHANPTPEGLRACVQTAEGLDVLPGYADVQSAVDAPVDPNSPGGLNQLVMTAALAGYSVIVLDAPSTERAALALAVANQLLLVARPTNSDALRSVEAFRTVTERLKGQHRVSRAGLRVVLNQVRTGLHSAKEFHEACAALLGAQHTFPPIVATLPDDPRVPAAQNARQIPLQAAPDFARAFGPVAETCLQITPATAATPAAAAPAKPKFQLGPITVN